MGQDAANMTLSNLLQAADNLVSRQQFIEARPYLEELVNRFQGSEQKDNLEGVYFYLGISYLVEYSSDNSKDALTKAIEWLQRMQKEFPNGENAVKGYLYEADAYRGLQDFLKAAEIYEKLLRQPLEGRMNYEQRMEVLEKLSECLYIKREWKRGLPYFEMFLKETRDPNDQASAAAALLEGNIKEKHYDVALEYLRFLVGESPARYNLQLNVALIDAGDQLAKEKRYTEAMLMYRMVLTVDQIKAWQNARLEDLEAQLSRLRMMVKDKNNDRAIELETNIFNAKAQIEALDKLKPYTVDLKVRIARNYLLTNRDWESFYAYRNLIKDYPDNPNLEQYIYAAFTGATKINKPDAVVELGEDYLGNPKYTEYRDDVIVKLLEYYKRNNDYLDFFDLSKAFVAESPDKDYAKSVIFLMGDTYTRLEQYDEMKRQFMEWDKQYPTSTITPGLKYWIGLALILENNYGDAFEYYNDILLDYPSSTYAEDSLYRRGICSMGIEEFDAARRDFSQYIREYPNTSQRGEVEFFLGEIDSATGNIKSALTHYGNVEKYTDNIQFIQNSYFRMAALLEANGEYQQMAEVLRQFIEKYADQGELTAAIYQLGRAYELNQQPHLMLKEYIGAISEFGDDPYTYGLDEILRVYPQNYYKNQELIEQNLNLLRKLNEDAAYRNHIAEDRQAIFVFLGENPLVLEPIKRSLYDQEFRERLVQTQEDIQPWLAQFENLKQEFPQETPEQTFSRLYKQAREDKEETLALRLQYSLDKLGVKVDPGRVFTEDDYYYASPVTLIWVGQQIQKYDASSARTAFEMVIEDHANSDQVFNALLALGDLEMEAGNFEQAKAFYEKAEADFPRQKGLKFAAMKQGDIARKLGDHSSAREKYRQISTNREWRGPIHAEALYKTGESYEEEGDQKHALAAYQRVYIGYPAYKDWAAKAYLKAGRILVQLGEKDKARAAYDEFLSNADYRSTDEYTTIQQERKAL
ncbi:tetratricopeptide repeat protein [Cerasicoccus fimbriatus]|uniref:tetratricopeptide repeat protein n=1 Tax=Cerasicoccus fimbriatus TaxID=3014554 RepID=UPI0022B41CF8|nr:tetratricopeptide repeat protein [Cerasicoccus sp. TK19100]